MEIEREIVGAADIGIFGSLSASKTHIMPLHFFVSFVPSWCALWS